MKKTLKRLCTGFLALATVVTALPTTPVHAESKQYKVTLTLLVLVLFALVFMGYMSKVVFFSIAGVIAIGQITWVITARYLDKNTS